MSPSSSVWNCSQKLLSLIPPDSLIPLDTLIPPIQKKNNFIKQAKEEEEDRKRGGEVHAATCLQYKGCCNSFCLPNTLFPALTENVFIIYSLHLAQPSRLIVGLLLLAHLPTPAGARHSDLHSHRTLTLEYVKRQ
ncbi:hypothetical protein XENTR_v10016856 [Xenopus tropicalis]|nr:hypothetical protein XENTR_v10016856 [Xenopus tropicalis]